MSTTTLQPLALELGLPWKPVEEQEKRFKKWNIIAAIILLLLFIIIPWLPVFEPELEPRERELVKTKVILKKQVIPEPEPVVSKPKPKPVTKPEPKPVELKKQPEKVQRKLGNSSAKQSEQKTQLDAKAAVQKSQGLDKVTSELSALRGALNVAGMKNKSITSKKAGVVATADNKIFGENRAEQASTGISVSDKQMKGEIMQLSNHEATSVEGVVTEGVANGSSKYSQHRAGQRDMESIRRVFEAAKGQIYAVYNRVQRENPEISGRFTFRLVIEPDGQVSDLMVVSSELGVAELEQHILSRLSQLNFGQKDVAPQRIQYNYQFFPS